MPPKLKLNKLPTNTFRRILIYLILGSLLNLTAALLIAATTPLNLGEDNSPLYSYSHDTQPRWTISTSSKFGLTWLLSHDSDLVYDHELDGFEDEPVTKVFYESSPPPWAFINNRPNSSESTNMSIDVATGWPMRSLHASYDLVPVIINEPNARIDGGFILMIPPQPRLLIALSYSMPKILPYLPIWPGLIINTTFYAILIATLHHLLRTIRRARRITKLHCPTCNYQLLELKTGCPECGWNRQPPKRKTGSSETDRIEVTRAADIQA